ncbi:PEPxxWA-CTERM sorting domain-containing protein [Phenylobacterium sp.]|uniref:PEPxxWA-CTERM sorting domain-containing protein n=1 Tax=Phenylobacterium sp. TaxID=1871053 RepID=UPI0025F786BD|nr:PEPxxWA-CTERM sorting domain-containing protein [Phenylobacterium sp.]
MFNFKSAVAGLFAVASLTFATGSSAATTLNGVTLHRVEILGSTYDVTFRDGVFDTVFPHANLTFTTQPGAEAAVAAIRSTAAYQSVKPADPGFGGFLAPFGFRDEIVVWAVVGGGFNGEGGGGWYRAYNYGDQFTWAEFSPSAVPEPATWAMMIIGFGAAGAIVRTSRRRNALSA